MSELNRFLEDPDCVFAERLDDRYDWRKRYNNNISGVTIEKGPFGNNFVFDGSNPDYAAVDADTHRGNLISTEDFSMVMWMKNGQTLTGAFDVYNLVTDKNTSNGTLIGWTVQLSGGTEKGLNFRINDGGQANDSVVKLTTDRTTLLSNNDWHLVAVSADRSGNATLYVDNFTGETGDISSQSGSLSNDQDLTLGVYGNKTSQPFTGSMRDVMIFKNRILTAKEILNIYKGRSF
jgi:hypothetical protein